MAMSMEIDSEFIDLDCGDTLSVFKEEVSDHEEFDGDDDLPPILAPPSTGYFHSVDENQPPPELHPFSENDTCDEDGVIELKGVDEPEVIDIEDSGSEKSSTTDSDDELVDVDYEKEPPPKYTEMLEKNGFMANKENWIYNIRKFYKNQPTRIRRLLKMHHDQDGNPIEEPMELLFEKIHAERERMRKAQTIKTENVHLGIGQPDETVASLSSLPVSTAHPRLVHVAYPGNVVNNDKAMATLGGLGAVSKVFEQPNKKLHLRFRPNDPFANGVNAQGRTVCGLLIRVRKKKDRPASVTNQAAAPRLHEVVDEEPDDAAVIQDLLLDNQLHCQTLSLPEQFENTVKINEEVFRPHDVSVADKYILDDEMKKDKTMKAWTQIRSKEFNLKIPKQLETISSKCEVQTVGIVHRSYDFNGICDFQYLPITKKPDGSLVSVKDKIFPILGGTDAPEKLVMKDLISEEIRGQTFSLPPSMSRIDNPPRGLMDDLIVSEKSESTSKKEPTDDAVFSNRRKRIIFTVSYNFIADGKLSNKSVKVPSRPLPHALEDVERRQIKKEMIDIVRSKFDERPIWSKAALEFATQIPTQILKYIIPTFAYFAANGPWRNTWIKFGVDPRKQQRLVLYQAVDFRVPFIYRRFMNNVSDPEANHKYIPRQLPPKTQMFYQLCDILLEEIKELISTLKKKADMGQLVYDDKYGFLREGTYEYFRYLLNHHLENLLLENGKIPAAASEPAFRIPPGEIEPNDKLKAAPHRRVKVKRIRRSTRKFVDQSVAPKKSKGKKGSVKTYQATLEDLALNDLPSHTESSGLEGEEFYEDDEEDEYSDE